MCECPLLWWAVCCSPKHDSTILLHDSLVGGPVVSSLRLGVLPSSSLLSNTPLVSSPLSSLGLSWTQGSPVSSPIIAGTNLPVDRGAAAGVLAPPSLGSAPFLLGDLSLPLSTQPIPAKLVNRIRSGQFIEMHDLLGDNIALTQHFESLNNAFPAHILPASSRPRLREVTSLPRGFIAF